MIYEPPKKTLPNKACQIYLILFILFSTVNESWCTDCAKKGEFAFQHNCITHSLSRPGEENRRVKHHFV